MASYIAFSVIMYSLLVTKAQFQGLRCFHLTKVEGQRFFSAASYQFKKVNQFVNVLSCGKVHKVLGQSVAQVGTGLHGDFAVRTTEHWIILWERHQR